MASFPNHLHFPFHQLAVNAVANAAHQAGFVQGQQQQQLAAVARDPAQMTVDEIAEWFIAADPLDAVQAISRTVLRDGKYNFS